MTQSNSMGCLLTITQVAKLLNSSLKTVRRRIDAGELPVIRDGRLVRIHPNDLDRYVAARRMLRPPVSTYVQ